MSDQVRDEYARSLDGREVPTRIKVVGVGCSGCSTVRYLVRHCQVPGVEYVAVNTDAKSLELVEGALRLQIGEQLARSCGASGDARIGERAAEESRLLLKEAMEDAEVVLVTAGMGGGTGTGAAHVVADVAKENSALVIGLVTAPYSFEGRRQFLLARGGIRRLTHEADCVAIVHNDRLCQHPDTDVRATLPFAAADMVMSEGIMAFLSLVNVPGRTHVPLTDIMAVVTLPGAAMLAIGRADAGSRHPAIDAASMALSHPLLDADLARAKGVLVRFCGGPDLALDDVNDAATLIAGRVDPDALIVCGVSGPGEHGRAAAAFTLIASGIDKESLGDWFPRLTCGRECNCLSRQGGARHNQW